MSRINFWKQFRIFSSASVIFCLLFAAVGFAIIGVTPPVHVASAQAGGNMQVSFVYPYSEDNNGDKRTAKYTASTTLSPVTGGYAGNGTGTYEGLDISQAAADPCTAP